MKHTYKYLLTILPLLSMLISCDNGDIPKYSQLKLDANEVLFNYAMGEEIKGTKELTIVTGNGNYTLTQTSNNITSIEALDKIKEIEAQGGNTDDIVVATVKMKGGKLIITPLYTGVIRYQLQDWAKSSQEITITVEQEKPTEEIITRASIFNIRVGETKSTEIYSGNGGYKVESLDPSVATVSLNGVNITVTAMLTGNTKIKITDQKGKEGLIEVNVDDTLIPLTLLVEDPSEVIWLTTGGVDNAVLHYEGGNGGMKYTSSYVDVTFDENVKTITISGRTSRSMNTLKVSDRYGQEISIKLAIDYPFLDDNLSRILRNNTFATISKTKRAAEYIASINRTIIQSGTATYGIGISFTGDMNVGIKQDGKVYNVTKTGSESPGSEIFLSECEVVKIENENYWITFVQKETGQKGYMVIPVPIPVP